VVLMTPGANSLCVSIQKLAQDEFEYLAGRIFAILADRNRPAYDWLMSKVVAATLEHSGCEKTIAEVKRLLLAGDTAGATKLVNEVEDWMARLKAQALQGNGVEADC
jgi:hypothetical protein